MKIFVKVIAVKEDGKTCMSGRRRLVRDYREAMGEVVRIDFRPDYGI